MLKVLDKEKVVVKKPSVHSNSEEGSKVPILVVGISLSLSKHNVEFFVESKDAADNHPK